MKEIFIDQIVSSLGSKISHLRKQKDLSLHQLAERAGVSVTTIHKLERSEMTPGITVLMKVADALGEKVGFFLGEESNGFELEYIQGAEYTPKGGGKKFRNTSGNTQVDYLAFRLKEGKLLVLLSFLKAGTKSGPKPQSHPGEEFVFCLTGEIQYEIDGKTYLLKKGDSLHFYAHLPHRREVIGNKGTINLWIITPPPTGGVTELWK
jgi:transcriptional regulator with XRE-family HTH domain